MTRVRTKGGTLPGTWSFYDVNPPAPGEVLRGTYSVGEIFRDEQQITDVPHPGYKKQVHEGVIVNSPCMIDDYSSECTPTNVVLGPAGSWGQRRYSGYLISHFAQANNMGTPIWFDLDVYNAKQHVVNEAYAKAYSSDAQIITSAAELSKTVAMIRRPLATASKMLWHMISYRDKLVRGRWKRVKRDRVIPPAHIVEKAAADTWLEYRMGWKPLLYDIENIVTASNKLADSFTKSTQWKTYRANKTLSWAGNDTYAPLVPGLSSCTVERSLNYIKKISAGVLTEENLFSGESRAFHRPFGMDLRDLAPSFWELVPLSFVVDRFVDVSTWIQAISPRPGVNILASWQSTVTFTTHQHTIKDMYIGPIVADGKTFNLHAAAGSYHHFSRRLDRRVDVTPSIIPTWNPRGLSLNQHADHAALIAQSLGGFIKRK